MRPTSRKCSKKPPRAASPPRQHGQQRDQYVLLFRGSAGGIGASAKANTTGSPSLSLTTTQAHSAVVVAAVDWNAVDGSSRNWLTGAGSLTETTYARSSGTFTVYGGVHPDAGAAGAKTLGLSAPSGQKYSIVAVEVKP